MASPVADTTVALVSVLHRGPQHTHPPTHTHIHTHTPSACQQTIHTRRPKHTVTASTTRRCTHKGTEPMKHNRPTDCRRGQTRWVRRGAPLTHAHTQTTSTMTAASDKQTIADPAAGGPPSRRSEGIPAATRCLCRIHTTPRRCRSQRRHHRVRRRIGTPPKTTPHTADNAQFGFLAHSAVVGGAGGAAGGGAGWRSRGGRRNPSATAPHAATDQPNTRVGMWRWTVPSLPLVQIPCQNLPPVKKCVFVCGRVVSLVVR